MATMLRKFLVLLSPLALVATVEVAFRCGIWEPLAAPTSHAGTSVRLKRALRDPAIPRIDTVTLGSSRPEYGIDHALLAEAARRRGDVHANLSMPGSHWMTIGVLSNWLARERPEIRGGLVALSIQDLMNPGNGAYELGIVEPFRRFSDTSWIAAHVPFRSGDIATWATYSSLFAWRADIQDYVQHPFKRDKTIRWFAENRGSDTALFGNPESHGDMCAWGLEDLSACARVEASTDAAAAGLQRQCRELRSAAAGHFDFAAATRAETQPGFMQRTRDLVQAQLRAMPWPQAPIVVLMPMPRVWMRDVLGPGLHEWALSILQPLVDDGRIRLIDATDFFAGERECAAFFDFYHQNAAGRERFTRWLLPRIGYADENATAPH